MIVGVSEDWRPSPERSVAQPWVTFVMRSEMVWFEHADAEQTPVSQELMGATREEFALAEAKAVMRPVGLMHANSEEVATLASVDWHWEEMLRDGT